MRCCERLGGHVVVEREQALPKSKQVDWRPRLLLYLLSCVHLGFLVDPEVLCVYSLTRCRYRP